MTNDFSGGLRGLRPPATFFGTLRVAPRSVSYFNAFVRVRASRSFAGEGARAPSDDLPDQSYRGFPTVGNIK